MGFLVSWLFCLFNLCARSFINNSLSGDGTFDEIHPLGESNDNVDDDNSDSDYDDDMYDDTSDDEFFNDE